MALRFTGSFVSACLFRQAVEANNLEESLSQWEFELNKFKPYNWQALPRLVKWQWYRVRQEWPLQEHLLSGQAPTYAKVKTTSMEYLLQSHNSIYKTQTEVVKRKQQSRRRISVIGHISNHRQMKGYKGRGKQEKGKGNKGNKGEQIGQTN